MSTNIQYKELLNKVIDLELIYSIKESELYLKFLDNQINFYQHQIEFLEDNKPLFFQMKKLKEYNKKIDDYKQKIYENYKKINEEIDIIREIRKKNRILSQNICNYLHQLKCYE